VWVVIWSVKDRKSAIPIGNDTLNWITEVATLETAIPTPKEIQQRINAAKPTPEDRTVGGGL
jgi:hypothetical protein